jgi:non-ribosomal peptide synthase protein (TIGR01720 family)
VQAAKEPRGCERHPSGERSAVWQISGGIVNGALQLEVEYSRGLHRCATVNTFAQRLLAALRDLAEIASSSLETHRITPEDFLDVDLSQQDLDHLLEEIGEMGEG